MSKSTAAFYDVLKALGTITPDEVPDRVTTHLMGAGFYKGEPSQVRQAVALYSRIAAQTTSDEFQKVCDSGELPPIKLTPQEMQIATGGAMTAGRTVAKCCGHTCEGTCTP
ncbi:hypothetical protein L6R52_23285 [Myxococcota bacterium]|nr:hypothetical protein [Myxococcota bacterium]